MEGKRISLGTSDYTDGADVRLGNKLTAMKSEASTSLGGR